MGLHLPYSEGPEDEFQMPDGSWSYSLRAVVTDGWLFWKHALPPDREQRKLLDPAAVAGITALATALHSAHQRFPDFAGLDDTPFVVGQWWDPSDHENGWASGEKVLLRVNGFNAVSIQTLLRGRNQLSCTPRSEHWIEIQLSLRSPLRPGDALA